jgi:hypothetical protein
MHMHIAHRQPNSLWVVAIFCALLWTIASPSVLAAEKERPLRAVFPEYPEDMKAAGVEQVIEVRVQIARNGLVTEAALVNQAKDSYPAFYFAGSLIDAVWQWRYPPAKGARGAVLRFTYKIVTSAAPQDDYVIYKPPSEILVVVVKSP